MTTSKTTLFALAATWLCLLSMPAAAGSLDVVINGKSYHVDSRYDWNEENLGLGFEYEFASNSRWIKTVNANSFVDSQENMSYMTGAGLKWRVLETDRWGGAYFDAGVVAFIMARKDINDYRPFPGVLPAFSFGNQYAGVNVTYLPRKAVHDMAHANVVDPTIGGIVFMQFKLRLQNFN